MLRSLFKRVSRGFALAGLVVLFGAGTVLAQTGRIEGTVRDARSGDPIAGAAVTVVGTDLSALTNENGYFALTSVPTGVYSVHVRVIGYQAATITNTQVASGIPVTVNFSLTRSILRIEGVVVTGVADATQSVKLPFTVDQISAEELPIPAMNPEEALRGKVAGAMVIKGSGRPGSGTSVLLRGSTSINTSGRTNEPLYVVDGVILGASMVDIDALDIQYIEVVKGAAAAALYGARAANGVVQITTARGANLPEGETRVKWRTEVGKQNIEHRMPLTRRHHYASDANNWLDAPIEAGGVALTFYDTTFSADGTIQILPDNSLNIVNPRSQRTLDLVRDSTLAPDGVTWLPHQYQISDKPYPGCNAAVDADFGNDPGPCNDHFDAFIDPGTFYTHSFSIAHRTGSTNFLASVHETKEAGIVFGLDGYKRRGSRLNIDHRIGTSFDFRARVYYSQSESDLEDDGFGDAPNPFFSLPRLEPDLDLLERYPETQKKIDACAADPACVEGTVTARDSNDVIVFIPQTLEENPVYLALNQDTREVRGRLLGSLGLRWRPVSEFDVETEFSFDRSDRNRSQFWFVGYRTIDPSLINSGRLRKRNQYSQALNGSVSAAWTRTMGDLNTSIKARVLVERQLFESITARSTGLLVNDVKDLDNADANDPTAQRVFGSTSEVRSLGYFLSGTFDYRDRYIVDALVRRDGSSLFGVDQRWHTYYRIGGAYRMAQESWWPIGVLDEFKLRYSRGTAGGRPNFSAQFETFNISGGVVTKANLGNKLLKPEFATETEIGVDLIAAGRLSLSVSHASSTIENQLLPVPLPGFVGFGSQWRNAGTLETDTWEATLQFSAIQSPDVSWNWSIVWDRTRGTITKLESAPFFLTNYHYIKQGDPLGELWGDKVATSCTDIRFDDGTGTLLFYSTATECLVGNGGGFDINDDGYLVPVGQNNVWTDGIDKRLYGSNVVIDGVTYGGANARGKGFGYPIIGVAERIDTLGFDAAGLPIIKKDTTRFQPIGNSLPDFNFGVAQTFTYKGLTLYTLFNAQIGGDIYTNTRQWGCRDQTCWEYDQDTQDGSFGSGAPGAADNTKKPTDYITFLYNVNDPITHFVESGTYLKLRELSLRYSFGRSQLSGIAGGLVKRVSLSLIGRNLLTFTGYKGYDPEVSTQGGESALLRIDAFGYPNFRTFTVAVEFEF